MNKWAFTFGHNHFHNDICLESYYVLLEGSFEEARAKMFELRNSKWSMQYPFDDKFKKIAERWNWSEIVL